MALTEQRLETKLYPLLAAEHERLHLVAAWPQSAYKDAVMNAIKSSIQSLTAGMPTSFSRMVCLKSATLTAVPSLSRLEVLTEISKAA
jgi:hypothetical protein